MIRTEDTCPYCGNSLENNSSNLICMNCGHSLTLEKKFDRVDAQKISSKDENTTNFFVSLGALWWVLLIIGGIVSSIISLVLMFELL